MIYWIWLTQIPFIGPVTTRYLIKELGDAEKIYQTDYETLSEMSGLSASLVWLNSSIKVESSSICVLNCCCVVKTLLYITLGLLRMNSKYGANP